MEAYERAIGFEDALAFLLELNGSNVDVTIGPREHGPAVANFGGVLRASTELDEDAAGTKQESFVLDLLDPIGRHHSVLFLHRRFFESADIEGSVVLSLRVSGMSIRVMAERS